MGNIYSTPIIPIIINGHKYNVHSALIEKYFTIGIIDNDRFTDVYDFVIEHNGVQAPKIVGDNIVLGLYTDFKTEDITNDIDNATFYMIFISTHLTIKVDDCKFPKIVNAKIMIDELHRFLTNTDYEIKEQNYDVVGNAIVDSIQSLYPESIVKYTLRPYKEYNNYGDSKKREIKFSVRRNNMHFYTYLYQLQTFKLNIFEKLYERLGITEYELRLAGIDVDFYKNVEIVF